MNESAELIELLHVIEEKTRRAMTEDRVTKRIGPFLAAAHATNGLMWLSCALAFSRERGAGDPGDHVGELRAFFKAHNRRMRFEILEPLWPELAPALMARGIELQGKMPLMVCSPGRLRKAALPAGMKLHRLDAVCSDEMMLAFGETANLAFAETVHRANDAELAEWRRELAVGRYRSVYVTVDGAMAGVGTMSVKNDELVGIGTLMEFRRQGIAAAISSVLVAEHFDRGAEAAWLSAGDEAARRTYEKIGFEVVGDQVNLMDRD